MADPRFLLACGDWHGDGEHATKCFERAVVADADAIVQVGDFGFFPHWTGGEEFLDVCSKLAVLHDMPLYWVDGNHSDHTTLRAVYGPGGERHNPTPEGFWEIREGVYHIPRGTRWVWSGTHLMGLGGAYSTDRAWRLSAEHKAIRNHEIANRHRVAAGAPQRPYDEAKHKQWWAEEELTDEDVAFALRDLTPVDILFTHDKPRASNPRWNRKALLECLPNQDRIQTVVRTLQPKLLVHGHLHFRYSDEIICGDDLYTRVEGLDCNPAAQEGWNLADPAASTWLLLQLDQTDRSPTA